MRSSMQGGGAAQDESECDRGSSGACSTDTTDTIDESSSLQNERIHWWSASIQNSTQDLQQNTGDPLHSFDAISIPRGLPAISAQIITFREVPGTLQRANIRELKDAGVQVSQPKGAGKDQETFPHELTPSTASTSRPVKGILKSVTSQSSRYLTTKLVQPTSCPADSVELQISGQELERITEVTTESLKAVKVVTFGGNTIIPPNNPRSESSTTLSPFTKGMNLDNSSDRTPLNVGLSSLNSFSNDSIDSAVFDEENTVVDEAGTSFLVTTEIEALAVTMKTPGQFERSTKHRIVKPYSKSCEDISDLRTESKGLKLSDTISSPAVIGNAKANSSDDKTLLFVSSHEFSLGVNSLPVDNNNLAEQPTVKHKGNHRLTLQFSSGFTFSKILDEPVVSQTGSVPAWAEQAENLEESNSFSKITSFPKRKYSQDPFSLMEEGLLSYSACAANSQEGQKSETGSTTSKISEKSAMPPSMISRAASAPEISILWSKSEMTGCESSTNVLWKEGMPKLNLRDVTKKYLKKDVAPRLATTVSDALSKSDGFVTAPICREEPISEKDLSTFLLDQSSLLPYLEEQFSIILKRQMENKLEPQKIPSAENTEFLLPSEQSSKTFAATRDLTIPEKNELSKVEQTTSKKHDSSKSQKEISRKGQYRALRKREIASKDKQVLPQGERAYGDVNELYEAVDTFNHEGIRSRRELLLLWNILKQDSMFESKVQLRQFDGTFEIVIMSECGTGSYKASPMDAGEEVPLRCNTSQDSIVASLGSKNSSVGELSSSSREVVTLLPPQFHKSVLDHSHTLKPQYARAHAKVNSVSQFFSQDQESHQEESQEGTICATNLDDFNNVHTQGILFPSTPSEFPGTSRMASKDAKQGDKLLEHRTLRHSVYSFQNPAQIRGASIPVPSKLGKAEVSSENSLPNQAAMKSCALKQDLGLETGVHFSGLNVHSSDTPGNEVGDICNARYSRLQSDRRSLSDRSSSSHQLESEYCTSAEDNGGTLIGSSISYEAAACNQIQAQSNVSQERQSNPFPVENYERHSLKFEIENTERKATKSLVEVSQSHTIPAPQGNCRRLSIEKFRSDSDGQRKQTKSIALQGKQGTNCTSSDENPSLIYEYYTRNRNCEINADQFSKKENSSQNKGTVSGSNDSTPGSSSKHLSTSPGNQQPQNHQMTLNFQRNQVQLQYNSPNNEAMTSVVVEDSKIRYYRRERMLFVSEPSSEGYRRLRSKSLKSESKPLLKRSEVETSDTQPRSNPSINFATEIEGNLEKVENDFLRHAPEVVHVLEQRVGVNSPLLVTRHPRAMEADVPIEINTMASFTVDPLEVVRVKEAPSPPAIAVFHATEEHDTFQEEENQRFPILSLHPVIIVRKSTESIVSEISVAKNAFEVHLPSLDHQTVQPQPLTKNLAMVIGMAQEAIVPVLRRQMEPIPSLPSHPETVFPEAMEEHLSVQKDQITSLKPPSLNPAVIINRALEVDDVSSQNIVDHRLQPDLLNPAIVIGRTMQDDAIENESIQLLHLSPLNPVVGINKATEENVSSCLDVVPPIVLPNFSAGVAAVPQGDEEKVCEIVEVTEVLQPGMTDFTTKCELSANWREGHREEELMIATEAPCSDKKNISESGNKLSLEQPTLGLKVQHNLISTSCDGLCSISTPVASKANENVLSETVGFNSVVSSLAVPRDCKVEHWESLLRHSLPSGSFGVASMTSSNNVATSFVISRATLRDLLLEPWTISPPSQDSPYKELNSGILFKMVIPELCHVIEYLMDTSITSSDSTLRQESTRQRCDPEVVSHKAKKGEFSSVEHVNFGKANRDFARPPTSYLYSHPENEEISSQGPHELVIDATWNREAIPNQVDLTAEYIGLKSMHSINEHQPVATTKMSLAEPAQFFDDLSEHCSPATAYNVPISAHASEHAATSECADGNNGFATDVTRNKTLDRENPSILNVVASPPEYLVESYKSAETPSQHSDDTLCDQRSQNHLNGRHAHAPGGVLRTSSQSIGYVSLTNTLPQPLGVLSLRQTLQQGTATMYNMELHNSIAAKAAREREVSSSTEPACALFLDDAENVGFKVVDSQHPESRNPDREDETNSNDFKQLTEQEFLYRQVCDDEILDPLESVGELLAENIKQLSFRVAFRSMTSQALSKVSETHGVPSQEILNQKPSSHKASEKHLSLQPVDQFSVERSERVPEKRSALQVHQFIRDPQLTSTPISKQTSRDRIIWRTSNEEQIPLDQQSSAVTQGHRSTASAEPYEVIPHSNKCELSPQLAENVTKQAFLQKQNAFHKDQEGVVYSNLNSVEDLTFESLKHVIDKTVRTPSHQFSRSMGSAKSSTHQIPRTFIQASENELSSHSENVLLSSVSNVEQNTVRMVQAPQRLASKEKPSLYRLDDVIRDSKHLKRIPDHFRVENCGSLIELKELSRTDGNDTASIEGETSVYEKADCQTLGKEGVVFEAEDPGSYRIATLRSLPENEKSAVIKIEDGSKTKGPRTTPSTQGSLQYLSGEWAHGHEHATGDPNLVITKRPPENVSCINPRSPRVSATTASEQESFAQDANSQTKVLLPPKSDFANTLSLNSLHDPATIEPASYVHAAKHEPNVASPEHKGFMISAQIEKQALDNHSSASEIPSLECATDGELFAINHQVTVAKDNFSLISSTRRMPEILNGGTRASSLRCGSEYSVTICGNAPYRESNAARHIPPAIPAALNMLRCQNSSGNTYEADANILMNPVHHRTEHQVFPHQWNVAHETSVSKEAHSALGSCRMRCGSHQFSDTLESSERKRLKEDTSIVSRRASQEVAQGHLKENEARKYRGDNSMGIFASVSPGGVGNDNQILQEPSNETEDVNVSQTIICNQQSRVRRNNSYISREQCMLMEHMKTKSLRTAPVQNEASESTNPTLNTLPRCSQLQRITEEETSQNSSATISQDEIEPFGETQAETCINEKVGYGSPFDSMKTTESNETSSEMPFQFMPVSTERENGNVCFENEREQKSEIREERSSLVLTKGSTEIWNSTQPSSPIMHPSNLIMHSSAPIVTHPRSPIVMHQSSTVVSPFPPKTQNTVQQVRHTPGSLLFGSRNVDQFSLTRAMSSDEESQKKNTHVFTKHDEQRESENDETRYSEYHSQLEVRNSQPVHITHTPKNFRLNSDEETLETELAPANNHHSAADSDRSVVYTTKESTLALPTEETVNLNIFSGNPYRSAGSSGQRSSRTASVEEQDNVPFSQQRMLKLDQMNQILDQVRFLKGHIIQISDECCLSRSLEKINSFHTSLDNEDYTVECSSWPQDVEDRRRSLHHSGHSGGASSESFTRRYSPSQTEYLVERMNYSPILDIVMSGRQSAGKSSRKVQTDGAFGSRCDNVDDDEDDSISGDAGFEGSANAKIHWATKIFERELTTPELLQVADNIEASTELNDQCDSQPLTGITLKKESTMTLEQANDISRDGKSTGVPCRIYSQTIHEERGEQEPVAWIQIFNDFKSALHMEAVSTMNTTTASLFRDLRGRKPMPTLLKTSSRTTQDTNGQQETERYLKYNALITSGRQRAPARTCHMTEQGSFPEQFYVSSPEFSASLVWSNTDCAPLSPDLYNKKAALDISKPKNLEKRETPGPSHAKLTQRKKYHEETTSCTAEPFETNNTQPITIEGGAMKDEAAAAVEGIALWTFTAAAPLDETRSFVDMPATPQDPYDADSKYSTKDIILRRQEGMIHCALGPVPPSYSHDLTSSSVSILDDYPSKMTLSALSMSYGDISDDEMLHTGDLILQAQQIPSNYLSSTPRQRQSPSVTELPSAKIFEAVSMPIVHHGERRMANVYLKAARECSEMIGEINAIVSNETKVSKKPDLSSATSNSATPSDDSDGSFEPSIDISTHPSSETSIRI